MWYHLHEILYAVRQWQMNKKEGREAIDGEWREKEKKNNPAQDVKWKNQRRTEHQQPHHLMRMPDGSATSGGLMVLSVSLVPLLPALYSVLLFVPVSTFHSQLERGPLLT